MNNVSPYLITLTAEQTFAVMLLKYLWKIDHIYRVITLTLIKIIVTEITLLVNVLFLLLQRLQSSSTSEILERRRTTRSQATSRQRVSKTGPSDRLESMPTQSRRRGKLVRVSYLFTTYFCHNSEYHYGLNKNN